jgi:putative ABC transport system permease protein
MNLATFAVRNLLRRPLRSSLSIIGIALAVGSAIALMALGQGITRTVDASADERGTSLVVMQRGATDVFSGSLPVRLGAILARVPGVAGVSPELLVFGTAEQRHHVLVVGWSPESFFWRDMPLIAGQRPEATRQRSVVIGDTLAAALGRSVGDKIELFDETFTIAGISGFRSVLNRSLVILPLEELQELTFKPGQVTVFGVRLGSAPDLRIQEQIRQAAEQTAQVAVVETAQIMASDRNLRVLNAISFAIVIVALTSAVVGILNVMLMSVQEKTREIAILAAIGWPRRLIMSLVLLEGLALGGAGCLLGAFLGIAASRFFDFVPAIGRYIAFEPEFTQVAMVAGLALFLSIVGSLYPAWRALAVEPAEALRRS